MDYKTELPPEVSELMAKKKLAGKPRLNIPLGNPSPTSPIILKEWSNHNVASRTEMMLDKPETSKLRPETYSFEQLQSEPGNVRTIETEATPYDVTKQHQLSGIPASMWRGFYDSMNRWYYGGKKS